MSSPKQNKRQRERARHDKAVAKAARRDARRADSDSADSDSRAVSAGDQDGVLAELAVLHQRFADEQISFEEFTDAKSELLERLQIP